eukprot:CCRYP_016731-RA/>CCRYP_016731-RA protein AED:0.12 eAED:-0.01 QI:0/-1/0/1/-1/1/1/0/520
MPNHHRRHLALLASFTYLPILLLSIHLYPVNAFSTKAYTTLQTATTLIDPTTGLVLSSPILPPPTPLNKNKKKSLIVLLPQLGEFDSAKYCDFLTAALPTLEQQDIELKVIGIGNVQAATAFSQFTSLPKDKLLLDPEGAIHKELDLYSGPNFTLPNVIADNEGLLKFFLSQLPGGIPQDPTQYFPVANAWFNYLAMCAGIGSKGTLSEILRGYLGDSTAPERFREDDVVKAGFITIGPGVGNVKIGPLQYTQWFADERGYQRPVELATVRLKNMVEVLTKWDTYVSNPLAIAQRGGTYLFDEEGNELYCHKSTGVLTYSQTMGRPLSFLSPYIDEGVARNPLGLADTGGGELKRGRGILKPAGKFMGLLSVLFKIENQLQAKLLGAEDGDYVRAKKEIQDTISNHPVVVYTYGLSPFSAEALGVLDEMGVNYKNVEVGLEWFLLDKEKSILRAQLLELTGQSSLPHVFVNGEHVGGLFTGSSDRRYPGLAGLKESGKLIDMIGEKMSGSTLGDVKVVNG